MAENLQSTPPFAMLRKRPQGGTMSLQPNLTIRRGDTVTLPLTFTDSNDNPIDITGWKVYFTVKKRDDEAVDDSEALIVKDVTVHTDPTGGITEIALTAEDTNVLPGNHLYDIQYKTATSDIKTVTSGNALVKKDVTRRTT
mgnify:CR=1 FL=1